MAKEINDSAYWREFERNELTHSMAHYLMAIDALRQEFGYARVTDVADKLEVSRGAASMAIANLKKHGWVTEDPNRMLLLTEEGASMANIVEHNFQILSKFFVDILGIDKDTAHADACKMEHLMSLETSQKLVQFMRFLLRDPAKVAALDKFMGSEDSCGHSVEDCPVCQGECLAEQNVPAPGTEATKA